MTHFIVKLVTLMKHLIPRKYKLSCTGNISEQKSDTDKTLYKIKADKVRDFAFILSEKFDVDTTSYKKVEINTYNLNKDLSEEELI